MTPIAEMYLKLANAGAPTDAIKIALEALEQALADKHSLALKLAASRHAVTKTVTNSVTKPSVTRRVTTPHGQALSPAERARKYRETRKALGQNTTATVTKTVTTVTDEAVTTVTSQPLGGRGDSVLTSSVGIEAKEERKSPVVAHEAPAVNGVAALRSIAVTKRHNVTRWAEFRDGYPKRAGKQNWPAAEKKYTALVASGVTEEAMISGAAAYRKSLEAAGKIGSPYVQHASTFLNQSGWLDEYLTPDPFTGNIAGSQNGKGQATRGDFFQEFYTRLDEAERRTDSQGRDGDGIVIEGQAVKRP